MSDLKKKIRRIRTGGQSGTDRAAMDFAREQGIPLCGWCPKNGWAEDYPDAPGLLADYPELTETPSEGTEQRTKWNMRDGDAILTIIPDGTVSSPGTRVGLEEGKTLHKPMYTAAGAEDVPGIVNWIRSLPDGTELCIGGPRASECPGAYDTAKAVLCDAAELFGRERESFRIREAELTPELLDVLIRFSLDWEREESCHGYRRNERSDIEGNRIFTAEDQGDILGYLFGRLEKAEKDSSVIPKGTSFFEVEELYVKPEYRSKGFGRKLFAYAKEIVAPEAEYILLSTATKNWKSILHFYLDELGMEFWNARLFKKTDRKADDRAESDRITDLKLTDLQPSQFYISEKKLERVRDWFDPDDMRRFEAIPVKLLDGLPVMTDGHTRAAAALLSGCDRVPLVWDTDELDWDMYRRCVEECRKRNVLSPQDLLQRVISEEDYREKWDRWCDVMQAEIHANRHSSQ